MTKQAFLTQLRKGLSSIPQKEREERINFYSEMIDDRMEEGFTEEDAVLQIGDINTIVSQILAETSSRKFTKKTEKRYNAWTITLLVLGAPIWLSLLIAAFAVALSFYASVWAVIVSLWATFIAIIIAAVGCVIVAVVYLALGSPLIALAIFSASLVCAGIAILLYFACKIATNATMKCTKKLAMRQFK